MHGFYSYDFQIEFLAQTVSGGLFHAVSSVEITELQHACSIG